MPASALRRILRSGGGRRCRRAHARARQGWRCDPFCPFRRGQVRLPCSAACARGDAKTRAPACGGVGCGKSGRRVGGAGLRLGGLARGYPRSASRVQVLGASRAVVVGGGGQGADRRHAPPRLGKVRCHASRRRARAGSRPRARRRRRRRRGSPFRGAAPLCAKRAEHRRRLGDPRRDGLPPCAGPGDQRPAPELILPVSHVVLVPNVVRVPRVDVHRLVVLVPVAAKVQRRPRIAAAARRQPRPARLICRASQGPEGRVARVVRRGVRGVQPGVAQGVRGRGGCRERRGEEGHVAAFARRLAVGERSPHRAEHPARGRRLLRWQDRARGGLRKVHRRRGLHHEAPCERALTPAGLVSRLRGADQVEPLHGLRHRSHRRRERRERVRGKSPRAARQSRRARRRLRRPAPGEVVDHAEVLGGASGGPGVGIQPGHERRLQLPVKGQVEDGLERAARRRVRRQPGDELIRHGAPGRVRRGGDGVPGAHERLGGEAALQPHGDAEFRLHRRVDDVAVRAVRRRVTGRLAPAASSAARSSIPRRVAALKPCGDVAPPSPGDGERGRRFPPRRERRDESEGQTGVRRAGEQGARQLERLRPLAVVEQRRASRLDEEPRVQADVPREPRGGAVGG
mmetsp:Transcript_14189/g.61772  ORF Transcript_14189/g.61772 Transcript_14189/m.61772 type:complete len:629 (+) Transcript_14189:3322-5208(+)